MSPSGQAAFALLQRRVDDLERLLRRWRELVEHLASASPPEFEVALRETLTNFVELADDTDDALNNRRQVRPT